MIRVKSNTSSLAASLAYGLPLPKAVKRGKMRLKLSAL